ncbi:hypothetical protein B0T24DRAFT_304227 [Lasiosphaeria ovina]|uniref:Uncharacterized protein n=1 Tax=Lasiosphaeria ovina TaxID=92902 RepID=A0AAE0K6K1_9PEZI|nr:hypothetical protein B0T24DRAFT_304227 [Lasiosphaeria ovina]
MASRVWFVTLTNFAAGPVEVSNSHPSTCIGFNEYSAVSVAAPLCLADWFVFNQVKAAASTRPGHAVMFTGGALTLSNINLQMHATAGQLEHGSEIIFIVLESLLVPYRLLCLYFPFPGRWPPTSQTD